MGTRRLLTPDDVTQPRIRECLERLLTLTISTLREQNLLADLPRDFEIVAERMDPEVPEVFYFVSQSMRRVINYAYDCPCVVDPNPNPTVTHFSHPPEQCPNPKLSTFYFSPPPPPPHTHTPTVNFMLCSFFFSLLKGWRKPQGRVFGCTWPHTLCTSPSCLHTPKPTFSRL
jgi:hypothetical protein